MDDLPGDQQECRRYAGIEMAAQSKCDIPLKDKSVPCNLVRNIVMYLIVMACHFVESISVVLATARVPTRKEQPPLPDVVLDNVPYMQWCGKVAELCIMFIGFHLLFIALTHKYGSLIFQRFCQCMAVVTLLRTASTLLTSLSIPSPYTLCEKQPVTDFYDVMNKTSKVFLGMGMSIMGVHSCGDFMFSGHTAQVTAFCFFVREYTHQSHHPYLHLYSWIINILSMFFILAAQKHYTVDVIFAFIVTSFTINQYHQIVSDFKKTSVAYRNFGRCIFLFLPFIENCDYREALQNYNWKFPSLMDLFSFDKHAKKGLF